MRVGIITFYNGNINYGGMFQAYALQQILEEMGHDSKQICLDNRVTEWLSMKERLVLAIKTPGKMLLMIQKRFEDKLKVILIGNILSRIKEGFADFENSIPHTVHSYKRNEMEKLNRDFDIFVTGSDQVWTPNSGGLRPVPHKWSYFLDFTSQRKISYAASFGVDYIPQAYKWQVFPYIRKLDAISVREKNAKRQLFPYIDKEISVVMDPVFLLPKSKWEERIKKQMLMIEPRRKDSQYVFCYLLGKQKVNRRIAKLLAGSRRMELHTVPFVGDFLKSDIKFGDFKHIGLTPPEFLYYIHEADTIVTDSFHCAVFSIIFEKNFVVLKRGEGMKTEMNRRLYDLLEDIGLENRIADNAQKALQISVNRIDYVRVKNDLDKAIRYSIEWLKTALEG